MQMLISSIHIVKNKLSLLYVEKDTKIKKEIY